MTTLPPYNPPPPIKESKGLLFWMAIGCGGCLTGLALFIVLLFAAVFGTMSKSEPVRETLQRARANPQVVAALGTPIETGWFFLGNLNFENQNGSVDLTFTIKGPKGKARANLTGTKARGVWTYHLMEVRIGDAPPIDLLGRKN